VPLSVMSRAHSLVTLVSVLAAPIAASADSTNPNYLPFGERASMMGNAGFTNAEGEAVYYNPANLARIGHPSLSLSGSTYLRYEFAVDSIERSPHWECSGCRHRFGPRFLAPIQSGSEMVEYVCTADCWRSRTACELSVRTNSSTLGSRRTR
jgi:hypothetical protein